MCGVAGSIRSANHECPCHFLLLTSCFSLASHLLLFLYFMLFHLLLTCFTLHHATHLLLQLLLNLSLHFPHPQFPVCFSLVSPCDPPIFFRVSLLPLHLLLNSLLPKILHFPLATLHLHVNSADRTAQKSSNRHSRLTKRHFYFWSVGPYHTRYHEFSFRTRCSADVLNSATRSPDLTGRKAVVS